MAYLWLRDRDGEWAALPLAPGVWELAGDRPARRPRGEAGAVRRGSALLVHAGASPRWYLVAAPDCPVRVNGGPLPTRIRALADRDELQVGAGRMYFTTETLAAVVPFAGEASTCCARCRMAILAPTPAVACPGCGVWHHQTDTLPCWTYAPACALCEQPTALESGFRWTPEGL